MPPQENTRSLHGQAIHRKTGAGFSLIEVAIALGILSFAMIPLFGLLPVGMQVLKDANDTTIQAQVVQKLSTLAGQTEFSKLDGSIATKVASYSDRVTGNTTPIYYYFNAQGETVAAAKDSICTAVATYSTNSNGLTGALSGSFVTLWIDIYNNRGQFGGGGKPLGTSRVTAVHIADFGVRVQ